MRTTVTLDADTEALVKDFMRTRGLSFKQAVNDAIRAGLRPSPGAPGRTPTFKMGFDSAIRWDKALAISGDLEDDALIRKLAARK
ncbi:MAG: antitoxin [Actinomycetota bacterium]|nr:antitoxin [Actinomycetota bacterium]